MLKFKQRFRERFSRGGASLFHNEQRLELIAFLGGLCLFFSTIEYLFPKPVPFFRLGLANLPILITLDILSPGSVFLLVFLKVLGHGLINGTLASYVFLFSVSGSFASAVVMLAAHRIGGKRISLVGVSVFGAIASNIVQITLSVTFIFGQTAWVIAPLFIGLGVTSGVLVGLFAEKLREKSRWVAGIRQLNVS
ncbi:MAG: heptaprenyl diphosphate synthase [Spirochaetaceae bacterium]|nr:MAG: heptaprenyl diphosphate synthase [Spirochaetaceae bacterium]